MHLKNFSMILSNGKWILAPAYDLLNVSIVLPEDTEELALTLGGKKKRLNRKSFNNFGEDLGLNEKQINGVYKRYMKNKSKTIKRISESFLSMEKKNGYLVKLDYKYSIILGNIPK